MKAILVHEFGESNVLRLVEVPTPRPGPGQVLVRMHAISINPVETYIGAGTYARLPALPYTPGNDGAHEMFDHRAPDHFEQIMKPTGGRGVDVIVELLANVNLGKDLTILAKSGRVAIIGSRGRVEIDPRDTMQRDVDLRGMVLPNTPPKEMASIHAALVAGLENGTLRPVIGKEFPLTEAAQAHRAVMEPGALRKIVLVLEK